MNTIEKRILQLRDLINKQNNLYFNKNASNNINDSLYDQLLEELKLLENKYPQYKNVASPTINIGEKAENTFNKVVHTIPLLSLDKVLTFDDFIIWLSKMVDKGVNFFNFQFKYDGLANELIYENGELIQGSTRGNGTIGEDNTETVKLIPNIPYHIYDNDFKNNQVKIIGEIILLKEGFNIINKSLPKENQYQNIRNATSGIVKNKIPNENFIKYLRFIPYNLYINDKLWYYNYAISMQKISQWFKDDLLNVTLIDKFNEQINLNDYNLFNLKINLVNKNNIDFLKEKFDMYYNQRENLAFNIDGIVIKAIHYDDWNMLGTNKKYPNYAIAYKFPAMTAISILEDVEWLLGNKGNITPRAKIKPVNIGGTTITNPTLHNVDIINKLDLKIGDHIIVSRHGDVIPEIDSVIKELRIGNEKEIIIPNTCPVCGSVLNKKGTFIRCDNVYCEGRKLNKIEHFIKAMKIDNFGSALIEKLYNSNIIKDFTDIYRLTLDQLLCIDRVGKKLATKIINNIDKSKNNTLDKIINGLMIPNVSIEKGKILMNKYITLNKLIKCTYEELIVLPTFGEVIVNNILNYLSNDNNISLINKLIELNIIGEQEEILKFGLNNRSFCFTGKLSISRSEFEKIITTNNGVISSIKKSTDYLIIGDGAKEHKIEKAKKYNINIITENEFYNLIEKENI